MISGSTDDFDPAIWDLCQLLGQRLIEHDHIIVNGVSKNIGTPLMVGADRAIPYGARHGQRLKLFPFPFTTKESDERTRIYNENRDRMVESSWVTIVISGNKAGRVSQGTLDEVKLAREHGHYVIPLLPPATQLRDSIVARGLMRKSSIIMCESMCLTS